MAKDPAVLWYWDNWSGGTLTFSRHLKGCYMDLLNAQFNSGHLSLEDIKTVLGADFGPAWPTLQKKFKKDPEGLFFNERLDTGINKRKEYSETQRQRVNKRWSKPAHPPGTYVGNTPVLPQDGNGIGNRNSNGNSGDARGVVVISLPATKDQTLKWRENILADEEFIFRCVRKGGITKEQFSPAEEEFYRDKIATGEWEEWKDEKGMRRNLLYWTGLYGERKRRKLNGNNKKSNGQLRPTGIEPSRKAFGKL